MEVFLKPHKGWSILRFWSKTVNNKILLLSTCLLAISDTKNVKHFLQEHQWSTFHSHAKEVVSTDSLCRHIQICCLLILNQYSMWESCILQMKCLQMIVKTLEVILSWPSPDYQPILQSYTHPGPWKCSLCQWEILILLISCTCLPVSPKLLLMMMVLHPPDDNTTNDLLASC